MCQICGSEEEDCFDVVVSCTKAKALRGDLRKEWDLLPENELVISGPGPFIMTMDLMGFRRASSAAILFLEMLASTQ
jgi:hypothetical protein